MSHPFDRNKYDPQLGKLNKELGQKWFGNPFEIVRQGNNLSAYEANRVFLNEKAGKFYDVTGISGVGYDYDSRAAALVDYDKDGRLDLVVRSVGGKPLVLAKNTVRGGGFLRINLRSPKKNRRAIGARVTLRLPNRSLVQQFYPKHGFMAQSEMIVHFGLGRAKSISNLEILWPSGRKERFDAVPINREILVTEGGKLRVLH